MKIGNWYVGLHGKQGYYWWGIKLFNKGTGTHDVLVIGPFAIMYPRDLDLQYLKVLGIYNSVKESQNN